MNLTTDSTTPMASPARTALGNEAMPATAAAASARARVSGPRFSRPVVAPDCPLSRMIDRDDSKPAAVHTNVDTTLGFTPDRRASSGLPADAATARPKMVRLSIQPSAAATRGTTTMIATWGAVMRRPNGAFSQIVRAATG